MSDTDTLSLALSCVIVILSAACLYLGYVSWDAKSPFPKGVNATIVYTVGISVGLTMGLAVGMGL